MMLYRLMCSRSLHHCPPRCLVSFIWYPKTFFILLLQPLQTHTAPWTLNLDGLMCSRSLHHCPPRCLVSFIFHRNAVVLCSLFYSCLYYSSVDEVEGEMEEAELCLSTVETTVTEKAAPCKMMSCECIGPNGNEYSCMGFNSCQILMGVTCSSRTVMAIHSLWMPIAVKRNTQDINQMCLIQQMNVPVKYNI